MLSPAKKKTRSFLKQRISFHKQAFSNSKKLMWQALEEKRAIKAAGQLGQEEAGRIKILSRAAADLRKEANWHKKREQRFRKKKKRLFPGGGKE